MCNISLFSNSSSSHNFNNSNTSHQCKRFLSFHLNCAILRMWSKKQRLLVNLETTATVTSSSISLTRSFLLTQIRLPKRRRLQHLKWVPPPLLVSMQPRIIHRCSNYNNIQFNRANNSNSNLSSNINNHLTLIFLLLNFNNLLSLKKTEQ